MMIWLQTGSFYEDDRMGNIRSEGTKHKCQHAIDFKVLLTQSKRQRAERVLIFIVAMGEMKIDSQTPRL